ncbi:hypothetical protein ACH5RR_028017 [Cinchona calisaya]|uniref:DUF4408 domain-containing protein n=1 Tax=Cinchona calisaya TaxID=153742 RepID=A0ABD2YPQ2_9GENT
MSILSFSNNTLSLSLKLIFISTTVLTAAVALKLSVPAITDFAVTDLPSIYNGFVSWLRPPYLYLVINCIIITIVASSKLQFKLVHDDSPVSIPVPVPAPAPVPATPQVLQVFHHQATVPIIMQQQLHDFHDVVLKDEVVEAFSTMPPEVFEYNHNINNTSHLNHYEDDKEFVSVNAVDEAKPDVVEMSSYRDEFVTSKLSPATPLSRTDSLEFSFSNEKPPISARFGHRRAVKASPEGGKAALGVSKPKRQDTLESTWKTITEGRAMPLTRHLRKSDTWETHGGRHHDHQVPHMIKSETFTDRGKSNNNSSLLRSPSPGSGKLKKEPSLSQDELNRRVEAFIKKFNEEMRLQRQESLNQYMEMINRGAH